MPQMSMAVRWRSVMCALKTGPPAVVLEISHTYTLFVLVSLVQEYVTGILSGLKNTAGSV